MMSRHDMVSYCVSKHFPDATGFILNDANSELQVCTPDGTKHLSELFSGSLEQLMSLYASDIKWNYARQHRNMLLAACDHTALEDYPRLQMPWQQYRQALRDITNTFSNPDQVVWPEPPESLKV